jgi:ubiquinone/menaquinone biosynthesis C-methylase UbiE
LRRGGGVRPIDPQSPEFGEYYDELPLWSAPFGLWLLDCVPIRAGQTILDVGAGTGFLTIELAQRCYPSRVIAVDPWRAATRRLRKKIDYLGLADVAILEVDAAALELADDSVDLIVSNLGINNFENAEAVLRTCWRAARPGAQIFVTSNLVGTMQGFYDIFREVLVSAKADDRLDALERHIRHRATPESLQVQLHQAGFRVARVTTKSFKLRFASGTAMLRHSFMQIGFVAAWKDVSGTERSESLFETLEQRLNEQADQSGEISLTIPMALIEAQKS